MIFPNVASDEVVNTHLDSINQLFGSTGKGVDFWSGMKESDRIILCQCAGLDETLAGHAIQNFDRAELRRLRAGAKRLERLANRFNNISPFDFR
tara:strand:+ start:9238 stop:9519 length:282 start_codon:yes stop_codon:yes gene_type:complete